MVFFLIIIKLRCIIKKWSKYMLLKTVMEILSRLASLAQIDKATSQLIDRGMAYLDKLAEKEVKEMRVLQVDR